MDWNSGMEMEWAIKNNNPKTQHYLAVLCDYLLANLRNLHPPRSFRGQR